MGYTRVHLDNVDFTRTIIEAISEVRVEENVEFKSSRKKKEKTRFLAGLVTRSLNGTSRHKDDVGHGQDSFSYEELVRGLGKDYKKYVKPLFGFIEENLGYSSTAHSTKEYWMHSSVRKRARSVLRNYDGPERVVNDKGKEIFKHRWPKNGNSRKSEIKVPALIPIDLDTLNQTIETLEELEQKERRSGNARPSETEHINLLCNIRRWVRAADGVPNFYKEEATGRLGRLGEFHIIGLSNIRRKLLFRGSGWCDFDFKNCHYSIFQSLCSHHGFQTPRIDEYIEDHRDKFADLLWSTRQIPHAVTKVTFISLLYGGRFSTYSPTTTKNLSHEVTHLLSQEPWCIQLVAEIKRGRDLILIGFRREQKHTKKVTTNIVGKQTVAPEKSKRLAHVLFGYERWCLETVCRDFPDTKCLIYDGWISPDRDVKKLEKRLVDRSTAEFGFPIELEIKKEKVRDSVDAIL